MKNKILNLVSILVVITSISSMFFRTEIRTYFGLEKTKINNNNNNNDLLKILTAIKNDSGIEEMEIVMDE